MALTLALVLLASRAWYPGSVKISLSPKFRTDAFQDLELDKGLVLVLCVSVFFRPSGYYFCIILELVMCGAVLDLAISALLPTTQKVPEAGKERAIPGF